MGWTATLRTPLRPFGGPWLRSSASPIKREAGRIRLRSPALWCVDMGRKDREQASWVEDTQVQKLEECVLCGREAPSMTDHHLVPKSQGRRQGVKLGEIPTVKMCAACQGFLSKTFSNAQLANELNTVEAILARDEVQKFVKWVQKQPLTKGVRVH